MKDEQKRSRSDESDCNEDEQAVAVEASPGPWLPRGWRFRWSRADGSNLFGLRFFDVIGTQFVRQRRASVRREDCTARTSKKSASRTDTN